MNCRQVTRGLSIHYSSKYPDERYFLLIPFSLLHMTDRYLGPDTHMSILAAHVKLLRAWHTVTCERGTGGPEKVGHQAPRSRDDKTQTQGSLETIRMSADDIIRMQDLCNRVSHFFEDPNHIIYSLQFS